MRPRFYKCKDGLERATITLQFQIRKDDFQAIQKRLPKTDWTWDDVAQYVGSMGVETLLTGGFMLDEGDPPQ